VFNAEPQRVKDQCYWTVARRRNPTRGITATSPPKCHRVVICEGDRGAVTASPGLPRWIYVPAALGALFVVVPLIAVAAKVDWPNFWSLISSRSSVEALALSLKTAAASTALCLVLGVPMALVLARGNNRIVRMMRPLILLPLVLPPVVGGIALLYAFGRLGLVGEYLEAAGIRIAFTTTAVVLAQTFVSLPFLVIAIEGAARTAGADYEVVAATLGARPTAIWWRVSLPLLAPGLVSGAVLAFARSLGEFGATLTFAGSRQGVTRTLPLEIYLQRETDAGAAVALSLLLVVVAAGVVLGLGGRRLSAGVANGW
jgi:molybdate transport system permease protein